jgi:hypothetical protein
VRASVRLCPTHASRRAQPESEGFGAGELGSQLADVVTAVGAMPVLVTVLVTVLVPVLVPVLVTGLATAVVVVVTLTGVAAVVELVDMARAGVVGVPVVVGRLVAGALIDVEGGGAELRPASWAERPHPPSSSMAARKMSALALMYK